MWCNPQSTKCGHAGAGCGKQTMCRSRQCGGSPNMRLRMARSRAARAQFRHESGSAASPIQFALELIEDVADPRPLANSGAGDVPDGRNFAGLGGGRWTEPPTAHLPHVAIPPGTVDRVGFVV